VLFPRLLSFLLLALFQFNSRRLELELNRAQSTFQLSHMLSISNNCMPRNESMTSSSPLCPLVFSLGRCDKCRCYSEIRLRESTSYPIGSKNAPVCLSLSRHDTVRYSAVQGDTVLCCTIQTQCSTVRYRYSAVLYDTVLCCTIQCCAVRYSAVQYDTDTVLYYTIQCCTV
jgi:hypothetical protein